MVLEVLCFADLTFELVSVDTKNLMGLRVFSQYKSIVSLSPLSVF